MIYLMRHGQDDENYVGGWSDLSLLPEGREQVLESSLWIKDNLHIKKIVASDIKRAMESAKIAGEVLNLSVEGNPNLREQDKGLLDGMLKEEAYEKYPWYKNDEVTVDTVFPEGESLRGLYLRIRSYLEKIMAMDDDTLIVTHRGVINMIYFILNDLEINMDKKQFGVEVASVHELDKEKRLIKKVR